MRITRRQFIRATGTAGLTLAASPTLSLESAASPIDRQERVRRFNPIVTDFNPLSPLTVGNGELGIYRRHDRPADIRFAFRKGVPAVHGVALGLAHDTVA